MKKKTVRILLGVLATVLIFVGIFAYQIYKNVMGSEEISGKQEKVPATNNKIPEITSGQDDWPNWRGPNHDGKSKTTGIKSDWSKGLTKLWEVNYLCQGNSTASWASPVIQGNRLVVPGRDETEDLIFCINSETGEMIWKNSYTAETGTAHGPGPRATPAINENYIYTYGRSGDVACWQLLDGKMAWKNNVKEIGGEEPDWGLSSTPLVLDDKVIVQGGGNALVVAYNKKDGKVVWKSLSGPSGYSASLATTIENTPLLLVYHGTALSCLNPSDGKQLWSAPWETDYGVNATTPIIKNDTVFHSSGYGQGSRALKISKSNFKILWTNQDFAAQHSDPILIDGYIYGYSGESSRIKGDFKCIELTTGKEMWTTKEVGMGTCIYVDGYIICFDIKGNLFLIKPDSKKFNLVGNINNAMTDVTNPSWTVPVVANGKLYLRYIQKLVCYDLIN